MSAREGAKGLVPLLLISIVSPILLSIFIGTYTRFMADDFCYAYRARSLGIISASYERYIHWSGRFASHLLDYSISGIGSTTSRFQPAILLMIWLLVMFQLLYICLSSQDRKIRWAIAGILSIFILSITLSVSPSIGQSLYWGVGARAVIPPLILGTGFVSLVCTSSKWQNRNVLRWFGYLLVILIPFIAAGFNETYALIQTFLIMVGLVVLLKIEDISLRRRYINPIILGLFGSMAATILVFVAPGNQIRQASYPLPPNLVELIVITSKSLIMFLGRSLIGALPLDYLLVGHRFLTWMSVLIIPFLLGSGSLIKNIKKSDLNANQYKRALTLLPVILVMLLWACFLPAAYATSQGLPRRTAIIPIYILVCALVFWGFVAGRWYRVKYDKPLLNLSNGWLRLGLYFIVIAISLNSMWSTYFSFQILSDYRLYARGWDIRETVIANGIERGVDSVMVPALDNPAGVEEITLDPGFFVNRCIDQYYGITVYPDERVAPISP